jgi:translation initiation factor IF-1
VAAEIAATAAVRGKAAGKAWISNWVRYRTYHSPFFTAYTLRKILPKEDSIEVIGKVVEKFRAGMFSIELDLGLGKTVLATMAGRLRRNRIKIMNGDKVSLELSPYDLTKGRITYRHR